MRSLLLTLITACIALPTAHAQEAAGETKGPSRGVRFVCAAIAKGTPEVLKIRAKTSLAEVPLSVRSPGDYFQTGEDGAIALGMETGDKDRPLRPLALAKMPDGMTRATAILFPCDPQPDGTCYRVLLVDDASLKGGDVYLLNTLRDRCAMKLDGETVMLESGKPRIHRTKGSAEVHNAPVSISVEKKDPATGKPTWDLISASTWRLMPTRVEICVIYLNQEYQRPALKGLTIYMDQAQAAP